MKRFKLQIVVLILSAMIIISGCSKKENNSVEIKEDQPRNEVISLTVWGAADDEELLTEMIQSFQAAYSEQASFNITIAAVHEGDCKDKIFEDIGNAPDVFAFADDQLMELAAAGVIERIEADEQIKNNNLEGAVDAASINGSVYAYPMTADNGYFMYYNKKYLTEEDVMTLDQMLLVAESLNKKVTMDWREGWYLYSFFGNTGLSMGLNEDGITNHCDWNSTKGAIKGVDIGEAMLAIANNAGFQNTGDDGLIQGAIDDSVIAGVSGVWSVKALKEAWGENLAAAKLPTYTCAGEQVQMASYAGYKMIGVNSYSKQKEWASKLAEWITNEENQKLRFAVRGQGPSNSNAANSEEVKESPAIQALLAQSEFSSLQRVGSSYWAPVAEFAESINEGKATSRNMQSLLDTMVKKITAKIAD